MLKYDQLGGKGGANLSPKGPQQDKHQGGRGWVINQDYGDDDDDDDDDSDFDEDDNDYDGFS